MASSRLPSKVLEINEERIRLIDNSEGAVDRYATLTWLWGSIELFGMGLKRPPCVGLEIHLGDLPPLFRDVIRVTQVLGIRYLWLEFLCISHCDTKERDAEYERVTDYFTNAELNIVAGVNSPNTEILSRRLPPKFQPVRLHGTEDAFIGWLGTEAYNDPRGLRVSQYSDAWKYKSRTHLNALSMQEIGLARRNLVFQGDGDSPRDPETICTILTSQLYMQCQEEVRWENGRRRSGIMNSSSSWYELVEEYSGRKMKQLSDRIPALRRAAFKYSRASGHRCGEFLAGLWSNDLLRGLLWKAEEDHRWSFQVRDPSWSWAAVPSRVKHVWPLDATPLASIQGHFSVPGKDVWGRDIKLACIMVRSLLVEMKPVERTWSSRAGDIKVDVLHENEHKGDLMIRYTLDNFYRGPMRHAQLSGIRITRRIGLLLKNSAQVDGVMERVGLFIVAKPDTPRWTSFTGERDVTII